MHQRKYFFFIHCWFNITFLRIFRFSQQIRKISEKYVHFEYWILFSLVFICLKRKIWIAFCFLVEVDSLTKQTLRHPAIVSYTYQVNFPSFIISCISLQWFTLITGAEGYLITLHKQISTFEKNEKKIVVFNHIWWKAMFLCHEWWNISRMLRKKSK